MEEPHKKFIEIEENEFSEIFYIYHLYYCVYITAVEGSKKTSGEEIIVEKLS